MNRLTHENTAINFANVSFIAWRLNALPDITVDSSEYGKIVISLASLCLFILSARLGGAFPDWDQVWGSVPYKGFAAFITNKIIHATGGKHRSRHTHSIDISIIVCVALMYLSFKTFGAQSFIFVLAAGFASGWISHLVADGFTHDGIYLSFLSKRRNIRFVPKQIKCGSVVVMSVIVTSVSYVYNFAVNYSDAVKSSVDKIFAEALHNSIPNIIFCLVAIVVGIRYNGMRFKTGEEWEGIFRKFMLVLSFVTGAMAVIVAVVGNKVYLVTF